MIRATVTPSFASIPSRNGMSSTPHIVPPEHGEAAKQIQPMFPHYRPSHRLAKEVVLHTYQAGWLSVALALLLLWAFGGQQHPLHLAVLGISGGVLCLIKSAVALPQSAPYRFKTTAYLARTRENWFAFLIFAAQTVYMFTLPALLWFSLPAIDVPLTPLLHVGLFAMLALVATRRFLGEWALRRAAVSKYPLQEILRTLTTIIVTLLVAIAATHAISPFGHPITGDNTIPIVFIWVIAVFVLLSAVILLIDLLSGRRRGGKQKRREPREISKL